MKKKFFVLSLLLVISLVPISIFAQTPGGDCEGVCFPNPFGNTIQNIPDFILAVTNNVILPIGAVVVVIMVIYSGFLFVVAQGNETKLASAKKAFLYTVIGALILLGSWVIANSIKGTVCLLYETPPPGLDCGQ